MAALWCKVSDSCEHFVLGFKKKKHNSPELSAGCRRYEEFSTSLIAYSIQCTIIPVVLNNTFVWILRVDGCEGYCCMFKKFKITSNQMSTGLHWRD